MYKTYLLYKILYTKKCSIESSKTAQIYSSRFLVSSGKGREYGRQMYETVFKEP